MIALFTLSAIAYKVIFGTLGAIEILAFLLIHEGGHVWAIGRTRTRLKGIYFLPLIGANVTTKEEPDSYKAEFYTAIMGPTMDLAFILIILGGYWYSQNMVFLVIAAIFALTDMFYLLPVLPMDGGLMLKSIAFSFSPKIRLLLIILGWLFGSLIYATTIIFPLIIEASRFAKELFQAGFLLFVVFQISWELWQFKTLAEEEKKPKRRCQKMKSWVTLLCTFSWWAPCFWSSPSPPVPP